MVKVIEFGVALLMAMLVANAAADGLATATAQISGAENQCQADGVIEAVRTSVISTEMAGRITALNVKAGDRVQAGQLLIRIDERIANQQAQASRSQVVVAEAQLAMARKDLERNRSLFQQKFLSQAALDRAEASYKSAEAQAKAQIAQASAAGMQTGLHTLNAPYAGIVATVHVELGDMATPGKPLLSLYDPGDLRAVVNVPQSRLKNLKKDATALVEVTGAERSEAIPASSINVLPTADPVSNMVQVRLSLPAAASAGLKPGMFARARMQLAGDGNGRIVIPASAVFKRSELNAVYVVDANGKAQLRQIRPGRVVGQQIEVLAGLEAGEKVALDPLAAAKQTGTNKP